MQKRRRYVVAIAHASFCSVSCDHTMAGVIEQQSCQQVIRFVARDSTVGPLSEGLLPDCGMSSTPDMELTQLSGTNPARDAAAFSRSSSAAAKPRNFEVVQGKTWAFQVQNPTGPVQSVGPFQKPRAASARVS